MKKINKILMERDGMTEQEANDYVDVESEGVMEAIYSGDFTEAEDLFMSAFGLEPDYMDELI